MIVCRRSSTYNTLRSMSSFCSFSSQTVRKCKKLKKNVYVRYTYKKLYSFTKKYEQALESPLVQKIQRLHVKPATGPGGPESSGGFCQSPFEKKKESL